MKGQDSGCCCRSREEARERTIEHNGEPPDIQLNLLTACAVVGTPVTLTIVLSPRIHGFLDRHTGSTPYLVIDLRTIADRFAALRAVFPDVAIHYAVKANPAPEIVRLLVRLGARFDVASPGELDLCMRQGANTTSISYGNTIKKPADIAFAYRHGVRTFTTDNCGDLENVAREAPGSAIFCRILIDVPGSRTPFGAKFGCSESAAMELLNRAAKLGLRPCGVAFHVGSQHLEPSAWEPGIAAAARIADALASTGIRLTAINLGGGFPVRYREQVPTLDVYSETVRRCMATYFGGQRLRLMIEPGRTLVAEAGVIRSQVVSIARKSVDDPTRWVYLDVGRYSGLAETENEAITYRLITPHEGMPTGPVVLAGPSCDGDDVLYQHTRYDLPLALRTGDHVDILAAGAYTASYSSVGFNGFPPLPTHCIGPGTR